MNIFPLCIWIIVEHLEGVEESVGRLENSLLRDGLFDVLKKLRLKSAGMNVHSGGIYAIHAEKDKDGSR